MSKIDQTRENIGVSNLDDKKRKELFNKFVDAGGKVVQEKKKSGFTNFDREKQLSYKNKIDAHKKSLQEQKPESSGGKARQALKPSGRPQPQKPAASAPPTAGGLIDRIIIRFKLYFTGTAEFFNPFFKKGFIEKFNTEYKAALLEIQMIYLDLFRQNPSQGKEIIDQLDSFKPIYFETVEMLSTIYDRIRFLSITEAYENFPDVTHKLSDYQDMLTDLFKQLYVLRAYPDTILNAFENAIQIQMKIEKHKASVYAAKRKKIRNDVFIIFHKLLPRLYWIFCAKTGAVIPIDDPAINGILGITAKDRPGRRVAFTAAGGINIPAEMQENEDADEAEKVTEEAAPPKMPDELKKGLDIMYRLDLSALRQGLDRNDSFRFVKENDKLLIAYLLLLEFDREYSFILTTTRIKYHTVYDIPNRTDFRLNLSNLYNSIRGCIDGLLEYSQTFANYEKARLDKPLSNEQYIAYSKKLTLLEKTRIQAAGKARSTVRGFMDKVCEELRKLVEDMNGPQKIVANPQDEIRFDNDIEGARKLSGKKVYEAIYLAYGYATAFVYRLGSGGDLAGSLEYREGESPEKIPDGEEAGEMKAKEPAKSPQTSQNGKPAEPKEKTGSVLSELDDLF